MKKRADILQRISWALTNPTGRSKILRTLAGMLAAGVPAAAITAIASRKNTGRNAAIAGAIGAGLGGVAGYYAPKLDSMYATEQSLYDKLGRKILFPMRMLRAINKEPPFETLSPRELSKAGDKFAQIVESTSGADLKAAGKLGKELLPAVRKLLRGSQRKQGLDLFERLARQLSKPRRMNYPFDRVVLPGIKLPFSMGGQELDYQLPQQQQQQ